jgi:hypothetical protein
LLNFPKFWAMFTRTLSTNILICYFPIILQHWLLEHFPQLYVLVCNSCPKPQTHLKSVIKCPGLYFFKFCYFFVVVFIDMAKIKLVVCWHY